MEPDLPISKILLAIGLGMLMPLFLSSFISGGDDEAPADKKLEAEKKPLSKKTSRAAPTPPAAVSPSSLLELIKSRRSIFPKDYAGAEAPSRADLGLMLEAANWAPTHGKTEPWRFTVMTQGAAVETFTELCNEVMRARLGPESDKYKAFTDKQARKAKDKAKVAYLVAIGMKRKPSDPDKKTMPEWEEMAAVACAVQNMHLMATALGIGAYWSSGGPLDDPAVVAHLGLDAAEGDKCLGLFHVGTVAPGTAEKYRAARGAIEDKVTYL